MSNVTSISGNSIAQREPNETYIKALREELARAEAGETIGGVLVYVYYDETASYHVAGHIPHYTTLGALTVVQNVICEVDRGTE